MHSHQRDTGKAGAGSWEGGACQGAGRRARGAGLEERRAEVTLRKAHPYLCTLFIATLQPLRRLMAVGTLSAFTNSYLPSAAPSAQCDGPRHVDTDTRSHAAGGAL